MGNFSEGIWNIVIVVGTMGGIAALYLLTASLGRDTSGKAAGETMGHVWDEDLQELNNPLPAWWRNLFYITLAWGVLYLFLYPGMGSNDMLLQWNQVKQYEQEMAEAEARYAPIFEQFLGTEVGALAEDEQALRIGERLFASYCTVCHGADARGVPGFPNLTDNDWLYGGTPEAIEHSILDGRTGLMPAWAQALGSDTGVNNVTQYVLSLAGTSHDAAAAAAGASQYDQICAACHQADGSGNVQLGAPNLTDDVWLYGGEPEAIAKSIAEGRQGRMPAHREFLGEAKARVLAAYVYSLSSKQ